MSDSSSGEIQMNVSDIELEAVAGIISDLYLQITHFSLDIINLTDTESDIELTIESTVEDETVLLYDETISTDGSPSIRLNSSDVFGSEVGSFDLLAEGRYDPDIFNARRDDQSGQFTKDTTVTIEVSITHPNLTLSYATTAIVSITNPYDEVSILIGYSDSQFDNDESDLVLSMVSDGEPSPIDIPISVFQSAIIEMNGAGGSDGYEHSGGNGGEITVESDVYEIDTLRVWVAQSGQGSSGGWGRFNGGDASVSETSAGAGSTHVSDADIVDTNPDQERGRDDSIAIADGGGGGSPTGEDERGPPGSGGAGGARGGDGEGGRNPGEDGEGEGDGGDGGLGRGGNATGGDGGAEVGGAAETQVISESRGGGNSGHASVMLQLSPEPIDL